MRSRKISDYGGVVNYLPKFSLLFIVFALSALGLPGTSGFIGEFLVLVGAFKKSFILAILASIGVILAAAYMLWLSKRVIFGETRNSNIKSLKDIDMSEGVVLSILVLMTIFFGFYPEPLINTFSLSVNNLIENYNNELNLKSLAQN